MSSKPPNQNETQPEETTPEQPQQSINVSDGSTASHISQTINYITQSETEELDKYLEWALQDLELRMIRLREGSPQHESPYKSLEYFRIEDSAIFFGRKTATKELHDRVVSNRLMILNAPSGAGKSSLLNAGLAPLLLRESRWPVYVRVYPYQDNLIREIKQAIFPPSRKPWPRLMERLTLHEFLGLLVMKRREDDSNHELVIILDQFEQFLISLLKKEIHRSFVEILRDCIEDENLRRVRFVISMKREKLGDLLDLFEQYIPGILQNRYFLPPMNEVEIRDAITGPVQQINPDISFEPALLHQLIQELGQKVELTYLQIVCGQLYNRLPAGQKVITTHLYEEQGKMKNILSTYLDKTLEPLPEYKYKVARAILVELVGAEGAHPILRLPDFEQVIEPDPNVIQEVLEYLVNNRLLRRDMDPEEKRYELAHEYLAEEVFQMVDKKQMEAKKAQFILQQELANSRQFESKVEPKQLNYFKEHLRFRSLDNVGRQLLFESSLAHGHDVGFWLYQMQDRHAAAKNAAIAALGNPRIAKSLKLETAEDLRPDMMIILWEAYRSKDRLKRQHATETLWILESWLSSQEKSAIRWALRRVRLRQTVQHSKKSLQFSSVVLLSLLLLYFNSLEHPVPGKWVPIAAGSFVMGMNEEEADRAHQECLEVLEESECEFQGLDKHSLLATSARLEGARLPDFSILENEVTTAQYRLCIEAEVCTEPDNWENQQRGVNDPVRSVSWQQASQYCAWLGGRLPTEAEWEKAARGPENTLFPWGADWNADKANLEHLGTGAVSSILAFKEQDKSGYGVLNLAGNVREWTASRWQDHTSGQSFTNEILSQNLAESVQQSSDVVLLVVRGGSWETVRSEGISSRRGRSSLKKIWDATGFRCVCPEELACSLPGGRWWDLLNIP